MFSRLLLPSPRTMAFALAMGVLFLPGWQSKCLAVDNPISVGVPVSYRNTADGPNKTTSFPLTATKTNGRWVPQNTGWNGKYTAAGDGMTNKIENTICGDGFKFKSGADDVDFDNCKFFWDAALPAWTYVSAASCKTNCYGYATSRDYWVEQPGFNQIMQDEYAISNSDWCKVCCVIKLAEDHCMWINDCCGCKPDTIKQLYQKVNSSPVYRISFTCPAGQKIPDSTIYCKK
jgi:hypothetical protein